ncbi:hypothetical protein VRRI112168_01940 [Vreelandella rituensis]|uniref:Peptidase C-terminal archaeal/bacterial domain-containing protein n=1 Tax=Vreelandella rituensis TaxID=2282306 RepID=A0A368U5N5_9GAMM|nr:hypothetical protein [Halomonas rituensis]RCV92325.1 hypothetical protein DU506_08660 [Halomonas rituensis]
MNKVTLTASLLALGIGVAGTPAVASDMQERFREEGRQLDLTGFLQSDTDARSRSFLYGSVQEHDFTVTETGTYRFESRVPAGESEDYRVDAVLLDEQGQRLAGGEALGENGGLSLEERLAPGDYVLQVQGQKFGTVSRGGNSFYVTVSGVDVEDGVSRGDGIAFTGNSREGGRSAFVRRSDAVVAVAAPKASQSTQVPETQASLNQEAPTNVEAAEPTESQKPDQAKGFEQIVADVKIRASEEVLTFEVLEAGTVAISTSTYPSGYEDTYRIELDVLDESGNVVAEGAGEGFDGDVDLQTKLSPGRYQIRVKGQKFGSAHSGVNNYELKVEQLDRQ